MSRARVRPLVRNRFRGLIAGIGSTSGVRVVVGHWLDTPLGVFSDAMVQTAGGHRVLLAPSQEVADFIAATYTFDEIRIEPFEVTVSASVWHARSASLTLDTRRVTGATGSFDGADLGTLATVDPPPTFGFSATPRRPSVTEVVTTVLTTGDTPDDRPG